MCRYKARSGAAIKSVRPRSIADELGLRPGDRLERIDGHLVRDILEYSYLTHTHRCEIELISSSGERLICEIEKDEDEDIGLEFTESLFDGMMECTNNCLFCFVRQNPPGVRRGLRARDDDPRLSFLHGNYISMTNLSDDHIDMIRRMRLSPLYVSVHSTNPRVRQYLMGYDREIDVLRQLRLLTTAGISVHTQVVLCPQINDRFELIRTVADLARLHPGVLSVAVVPVGLTNHRQHLPALMRPGRSDAQVTIEIVQRLQGLFLEMIGTRFVFASDEFYLMAGYDIPHDDEYEQYQQIENGVGLIRTMAQEFSQILNDRGIPELTRSRRVHLITGVLGAKALEIVLEPLPSLLKQLIQIVPVDNSFFGRQVTVTGLLSGADILRGLEALVQARSRRTSERLVAVIPDVLVNRDGLFVDGYGIDRVRQAASELGVDLKVVNSGAEGLYRALMELTKRGV